MEFPSSKTVKQWLSSVSKKGLLVLTVLIMSVQVEANLMRSEVRTARAGIEALQLLQLIHGISHKCGDSEYIQLAPIDEFATLVKDRLKTSLENFQVYAEENSQIVESLDLQLSGIDCDAPDLKEVLAFHFEDYELAKYAFEVYDPIESPLVTNQ